MFEVDDGSKNSQGVTLIIMPKSQDNRFVLFPGHLMAVESEGGAGGFNNLMLEREGETGRTLYRATG